MTTLIHVSDMRDPRVLPALNLGVGGVVCSHVRTRAEAEHVVATTRFPPLGDRGAHSSVRSAGYGSHPYAGT